MENKNLLERLIELSGKIGRDEKTLSQLKQSLEISRKKQKELMQRLSKDSDQKIRAREEQENEGNKEEEWIDNNEVGPRPADKDLIRAMKAEGCKSIDWRWVSSYYNISEGAAKVRISRALKVGLLEKTEKGTYKAK